MPKNRSGKAGASPLTPREREVIALLAKGLRREEIAANLRIKPVTVDLHNKNSRKKLGAKTIVQAVAIAVGRGYVSLD